MPRLICDRIGTTDYPGLDDPWLVQVSYNGNWGYSVTSPGGRRLIGSLTSLDEAGTRALAMREVPKGEWYITAGEHL